ncbi:MAG: type I methionyl aminopeptidase [Treponemataceae bacterium]|nr:type I methionyl aminopeptidase [Treponemataceae bacterium]
MIRLKNEEEIAGIRKSCHLLADMFNEIIPKVRPGLSTFDVDKLCLDFMTRYGGKPAWYRENFPGAVCISINEEVIHGVPSKRRIIHDGDLVSIDAGIDLDGFISDSTHTVLVGAVKPEHRKLDEVTLECLAAGISACRTGNRISDISNAVFEVACRHGYGVVYDYCGHGVGLDVHEDPNVPNCPSRGPNPRIQAGMVLAIEPMINLGTADVYIADDGWTVVTEDHLPSAHEEHTVAVYPDHTEILTDLRHPS